MIFNFFVSLFSNINKSSTIKKEDLGRITWYQLEKQLPYAYGPSPKNEVRLKNFSELVETLNIEQKKALQYWLQLQVKRFKKQAKEETYREKEHRLRWLQIYSDHLQLLQKKTP